MKNKETDYLDKLFASSSDINDEVEVDVPLVDVPDTLAAKLRAIADSVPLSVVSENSSEVAKASEKQSNVKPGFFQNWTKVTSIAASLFVAIVGFQFYQQQQTIKQLEQAQADLATALHYLGEANRIARAQVRDSLNDNINKAGVVPAMEIGRDVLNPNFKQHKAANKTPSRNL